MNVPPCCHKDAGRRNKESALKNHYFFLRLDENSARKQPIGYLLYNPNRSSQISMKNWRANARPVLTLHLWYKTILKVWRKSWEPFRIYPLTSTANPAQFTQLAVKPCKKVCLTIRLISIVFYSLTLIHLKCSITFVFPGWFQQTPWAYIDFFVFISRFSYSSRFFAIDRVFSSISLTYLEMKAKHVVSQIHF